MAFNMAELQTILENVEIGNNTEHDCLHRLAVLQERFFPSLKKADQEIFHEHLEAHGIEHCVQEAYEYSFKGTVDEVLAEMILVAIKYANIKKINMDQALVAFICNKIHIAKYGRENH